MSIKEINSFEDFGFNKQFFDAIKQLGYEHPTPIQIKAIPLARAGHDIIAIAQTGTGKTAAYLLPTLAKLNYAQGDAPRALILAPTKELTIQIAKNVEQFSVNTDLRTVCLYGGIGPKTQVEQLNKGCDVIVSTPARFMEIYLRGEINVKVLKTLILDEADRLMDMGFMPQIRRILEVVPVKRQNLLFSATFPPKVEHLADEFLDFPERIEIAPQATAVDTVSQYVYATPNFQAKVDLIKHLFTDKEKYSRVIIFGNTKTRVDELAIALRPVLKFTEFKVIHSNKGQNMRINAIQEFEKGDVRVLFTTDVASRGIDINEVSHVFNFDVPNVYEDYIHRIGRTGRAYKVGESITLADDADMMHVERIAKYTGSTITLVEFPAEVPIETTPREERIDIERRIDALKRKEDPKFKGAFHEKKNVPPKPKAKKRTPKPEQGTIRGKSKPDNKGKAKGRYKK